MSAPGAGVVAVVGGGSTNVKSTVALNLALALARRAAAPGPRVTLVDLDGAARRALRLDGPGVAAVPWSAAALHVAGSLEDGDPARDTVVVDPPPRFGAATERALALADVVIVPVDASPLAARVLGEVAGRLLARAGELTPPRLRVVLARRLPRSVDRWGLVDRLEALAPGGLLSGTLPMARPAKGAEAEARGALLYAPGTAAERAYSALSVEVVDALAAGSSVERGARLSTTP